MGSTGFKHNSVPTLFFAAFGQVLLDICVLCRPFGPILHLILGSPKFSLRKKMSLRFTLYRKVYRTPSHGLERFVNTIIYYLPYKMSYPSPAQFLLSNMATAGTSVSPGLCFHDCHRVGMVQHVAFWTDSFQLTMPMW